MKKTIISLSLLMIVSLTQAQQFIYDYSNPGKLYQQLLYQEGDIVYKVSRTQIRIDYGDTIKDNPDIEFVKRKNPPQVILWSKEGFESVYYITGIIPEEDPKFKIYALESENKYGNLSAYEAQGRFKVYNNKVIIFQSVYEHFKCKITKIIYK